MSDILKISKCNIAQTIGETNRFIFHVLLVHISTCVIDGKSEIFTNELYKTLLITALAIIMYNLFFRKIIEPKIEKMKLICYSKDKRVNKKLKIDKRDPLKSKLRIKINEKKERSKKRKARKKN